MSDLKSKIPDINEITSMATKLFKDVKKSITEIIADYKSNHPVVDEKPEEVKTEAKEPKPDTAQKKESEEKPEEQGKKSTDKSE